MLAAAAGDYGFPLVIGNVHNPARGAIWGNAPIGSIGAASSNDRLQARFARFGVIMIVFDAQGIELAQDIRPTLKQRPTLAGIVCFGDLTQGKIKIQLLQGIQYLVAFSQQAGYLTVFLAERHSLTFQNRAGDEKAYQEE